MSLVATFATHLLSESPRFLYEKEKFKEARVIINKMSKMNKGQIHMETWIFDTEVDPFEQKDDETEETGQLRVTSPKKGINYSVDNSESSPSSFIRESEITKEGVVNLTKNEHDKAMEFKESPIQIMKDSPVVLINLAIIVA